MALFNPYAKGFNQPVDALPGRAWAVIFAGTTINLCLGCLYAWSVWLKYLTDDVYMKATDGLVPFPRNRPLIQNQCVSSSLLCS